MAEGARLVEESPAAFLLPLQLQKTPNDLWSLEQEMVFQMHRCHGNTFLTLTLRQP